MRAGFDAADAGGAARSDTNGAPGMDAEGMDAAAGQDAERDVHRESGQKDYFEDFTSGAGSEWTYTTLQGGPTGPAGDNKTASGDQFLGQFGDQIVSLTFANAPAGQVTISFDLLIIGAWDGNGPPADSWKLAVTDGPTLLSTTFSNRSQQQAYPDGGSNPMQTGAVGVYVGVNNPSGVDDDYALYRPSFTFAFGGGKLVFEFSSDVTAPDSETFALDNVSVSWK